MTVRQVRTQTKNTEIREILEFELAKKEGTFPAFAIPLRILEAEIWPRRTVFEVAKRAINDRIQLG